MLQSCEPCNASAKPTQLQILKLNNLPLFSRPPVKQKSTKQMQVSTLKSNCSLFSRLYIATQIRSGDLDDFFQHENQVCPPALSQNRML